MRGRLGGHAHLQLQLQAWGQARRHLRRPRGRLERWQAARGEAAAGAGRISTGGAIFLPGAVLFQHAAQLAQAGVERGLWIEHQVQWQGFFEQPEAVREEVVVGAAVVAPAGDERRTPADARQQQPPGGLQDGVRADVAVRGQCLYGVVQCRRQRCLDLLDASLAGTGDEADAEVGAGAGVWDGVSGGFYA